VNESPRKPPLFPLTQPPPPSTHIDTQSEADTTPQPTHCSPLVPWNFPSHLPHDGPTPRGAAPLPHSHLFLSRLQGPARTPLSPPLSLWGRNSPPQLPVSILTKEREEPRTGTKTDTHRLLEDKREVDVRGQSQAGRATHFWSRHSSLSQTDPQSREPGTR
jgi:hypothetical protein